MTSTSSPLPSTIPPIVNHILTSLSRHKQRYNTLATTPNSNPNAISNSVAQDQHDHSTAVTGKRPPPLFVAFQGPQGSGKTFLTRKLSSVLSSPPHNLQVAVLSIDDLYLPHSGLVAVAKEHAGNKLLKGRGLPGTHDILFGEKLLREVKEINNKSSNDGKDDRERENSRDSKIRFPVFEKSLHGGEGDRLPEGDWLVVRSPVDILLFEGWFVGFYPVPEPFIRRLFLATPGPKSALDTSGTIGNEENPIQEINEKLRSESTLEHILTQKLTSLTDLSDILNIPQAFRVDDILEVNKLLEPYVDLWELFDTFIQIAPPSNTPYSLIYKWRLEQEHDMKSRNGGKGMDDDSVKTFVDRYIPGYVFFDSGIRHGQLLNQNSTSLPLSTAPSANSATDSSPGKERIPRWIGNGLRVEIDGRRELVHTETF